MQQNELLKKGCVYIDQLKAVRIMQRCLSYLCICLLMQNSLNSFLESMYENKSVNIQILAKMTANIVIQLN